MDIRKMLQLKRPSNSQNAWLNEIESWLPADAEPIRDVHEQVMAYRVTRGTAPMLYCSHLDTVHATLGYQSVMECNGSLYTPDGECLGADDGAGVWLMLEMIDAGVQGTYLFHLGEERGCIGSSEISIFHDDWVSKFAWAVGFDRAGTQDVITHFMGEEGCPLDLANTLANQLSEYLPHPFRLAPNAHGRSTDVAQYLGLAYYCTNISVGYHQQHTPYERLNMNYLSGLRTAVIEVFSRASRQEAP